ncbi:hypothetical protein V6N13_007794 [Hibiscus sabdariffa]
MGCLLPQRCYSPSPISDLPCFFPTDFWLLMHLLIFSHVGSGGRLLCVGSVCKATDGLDFSGGLTPSIISAVVNLEPVGHSCMATRRPVVAGLIWPLYVGLSLLAATLPQGSGKFRVFTALPRCLACFGIVDALFVAGYGAQRLPTVEGFPLSCVASLVAFPCVSLPWSCAPVLVLALPHVSVSRYDSLALLYGAPSLRTWYAQALIGQLPALVAPRAATIGIASACPGMVPTSQARSLHYWHRGCVLSILA